MPRVRALLFCAVLAIAMAGGVLSPFAAPAASAPPPGVIPGQYIVKLRAGAAPAAKATEVRQRLNLDLLHV